MYFIRLLQIFQIQIGLLRTLYRVPQCVALVGAI